MTDTNPFAQTLQKIADLRAQAELLPPGRKRNLVLARADALEVTMTAFSVPPSPQGPQCDKS